MSTTADPAASLLLEACVTSLPEAVAAVEGGAHRLELCVALETGGLTPPSSLVADVQGAVSVPVFCMVRPRAGSFVPPAGEVGRMADEMDVLRAAGANGLVFGVLTGDGRVDADATALLVERAAGLPVTFHRAFDETADPLTELEVLIDAGVTRVLTGGGPGTAWDGRAVLRRLVERAHEAIVVLGAGRVRADHAAALLAETGLRELHARAEAFPALGRALS